MFKFIRKQLTDEKKLQREIALARAKVKLQQAHKTAVKINQNIERANEVAKKISNYSPIKSIDVFSGRSSLDITAPRKRKKSILEI